MERGQIQGGFFNWSALKMTKCQITCKSLQKSSKCQIFQRVWHLVIFRADHLKKPPCKYTKEVNSLPKITLELFHLFSILPGSEYSSSGHGSIAQMSENGLD